MKIQTNPTWDWYGSERRRSGWAAKYICDGELVATAHVSTGGLIEGFNVLPDYRGQGHGPRFLRELLDYFGDCYLAVSESETTAVSLYQKAGFKFFADGCFGTYGGRLMKTQGFRGEVEAPKRNFHPSA